MKISIYELLGLINDGKAPKKIKYKSHYWKYNERADDYIDEDEDYVFSCSRYDITSMLDGEAEVLEEVEDKEYEDIEEVSYKYVNTYGNISQHRKSEEPLIDTINALIRNQKYILEQLNK